MNLPNRHDGMVFNKSLDRWLPCDDFEAMNEWIELNLAKIEAEIIARKVNPDSARAILALAGVLRYDPHISAERRLRLNSIVGRALDEYTNADDKERDFGTANILNLLTKYFREHTKTEEEYIKPGNDCNCLHSECVGDEAAWLCHLKFPLIVPDREFFYRELMGSFVPSGLTPAEECSQIQDWVIHELLSKGRNGDEPIYEERRKKFACWAVDCFSNAAARWHPVWLTRMDRFDAILRTANPPAFKKTKPLEWAPTIRDAGAWLQRIGKENPCDEGETDKHLAIVIPYRIPKAEIKQLRRACVLDSIYHYFFPARDKAQCGHALNLDATSDGEPWEEFIHPHFSKTGFVLDPNIHWIDKIIGVAWLPAGRDKINSEALTKCRERHYPRVLAGDVSYTSEGDVAWFKQDPALYLDLLPFIP